jgi:hypothetical protein
MMVDVEDVEKKVKQAPIKSSTLPSGDKQPKMATDTVTM